MKWHMREVILMNQGKNELSSIIMEKHSLINFFGLLVLCCMIFIVICKVNKIILMLRDETVYGLDFATDLQ